jgi:hypothetical protein
MQIISIGRMIFLNLLLKIHIYMYALESIKMEDGVSIAILYFGINIMPI